MKVTVARRGGSISGESYEARAGPGTRWM